MENIDEKNRKPRRTKGTPSYYYRNRFAGAVIAAGALLFVAFSFTPIFRISNQKIGESLYFVTEEEIDRRLLFSLPTARSSNYIKKAIEDEEKQNSQTD